MALNDYECRNCEGYVGAGSFGRTYVPVDGLCERCAGASPLQQVIMYVSTYADADGLGVRREEADDILKRLRARGFDLVQVAPTPALPTITWTLSPGKSNNPMWNAWLGDIGVGYVMQYADDPSCRWAAMVWGTTWRRRPRRIPKTGGDANTVMAGKKQVERLVLIWVAEAGLEARS